jgi:Ca2+-binding EF-hand superfamily protein
MLLAIVVCGFGPVVVEAQNAGVSGFGSGRSSSSSGATGVEDRYRNYAANMLKRYDKNGSGALEREEWSQMRGDWWKSADSNGDGTITLDEILARLAGYRSRYQSRSTSSATSSAPSTSSSTSPSSSYTTTGSSTSGMSSTTSSPTSSTISSSSTGTSASTTTNTTNAATSAASSPASLTTPPVRKPYRFLTPTERLPAGLPEWFMRRDANGDGQVTLAEFSESLTDEAVAEFAKYDLNNDGVITPRECLSAMRGR